MLSKVILLSLLVGAVEGAGENPIRKVVRLMQDMQKEIETELTKEKELFEKFMCICNTYDDELAATAQKAGAQIKEMTSKIEEETAEKGQLTEELKSHEKDKAAAETDLSKATTIRQKEMEEQEESIAEGKFNAAALGKAIPALEKGASAASLMQSNGIGGSLKKIVESSAFIGSFDRRQIISFLDGKENEPSPAAAQIIGILKQMKSDMEKSVAEAIANEESAKKGYTELKAAKDQEIEVAAESIEAKEKRAGELTLSISQNTDSLEDAKIEKADAEKFLATLKVQCVEKKKDWDARFKLRKDEISAISDAIKILNDDDALDVFKKAMPSAMVQQNTGFLQQQNKKVTQLKKAQAILLAASKSMKSKSAQLDLILNMANSTLRDAQKSNNKGPDFSVVVKMIDNMLDVLKKEQTDDQKKKDWCVEEMQKGEAAEKKEQEEMDTLVSTIEEISDEIAGIDDEVKTLQEEISQLDRNVAAATEQRKKEHSEYSETISMTEAAVQLVGKAKNRLNKFYNPKAYKPPAEIQKDEDESFVQIRRHSHSKVAPPELPDVPELKKTNNGGVIGMMDEIVHELQMDMAQAKFDEKTAQQEYITLMAESQTSRAQDAKSITDKKASRSELEEKLVEAKEQRTMAFEELNNAHTYVAELHSSCDFIVENFALRQEARANEEESLKNARAVMQGA